MNIQALARIVNISEKEIMEIVRTSLLSIDELSKWYLATGCFPTKFQEKIIRSWGADHVLKILK